MEKAVLFTNYTNEDFTWTYNNVPFEFKAGQSVYMEEFKANHFAKHLVDRELHKIGLQVNDPRRESLLVKCFAGFIPVEHKEKMEDVLLNENIELEEIEEVEEIKELHEKVVEERKKAGRKSKDKVEEEKELDLNDKFEE